MKDEGSALGPPMIPFEDSVSSKRETSILETSASGSLLHIQKQNDSYYPQTNRDYCPSYLLSNRIGPPACRWVFQDQSEGVTLPLNVPQSLHRRVIEAANQFLRHASITATIQFCKQQMFMLCLTPEVHRVVQGCHPCQLKDQSSRIQKDAYCPSVQAVAPFQI